jgi:hypothetical protein
VLLGVTSAAVLLPFLGMAVPQFEVLRGFLFTWMPLVAVWIFVGLFHLIKYLAAMLDRQ